MSFMGNVKESVTRELWSEAGPPPSELRAAFQDAADEDWRRIAIGVIRAGGAIVPRAQVRVMGGILRMLEDQYLRANHGKATSGDFATYQFFRAREGQVLDTMIEVCNLVRDNTW